MPKLTVIADDITGANDTGVQFSRTGLETIVLTRVEKTISLRDEADIIVINTNTRRTHRALAYARVREAAKAAAKTGCNIVYKKIDSTLRGNIGAELEAIMDELNCDTAIIAPAFPRNKRVTIGGYQLIDQIPIERTNISKDPASPAKESHVPTLIQSQTKRRVGHVHLSAVMKGVDSVRKQINQQIKRGNEMIVIDAATNSDLKTIAYAIAGSRLERLTCGCAGFAEELPEAFGFVPRIRLPVVVIAGSTSDVTISQIVYAIRAINPFTIDLATAEVLEGRSEEETERVVKEIGRAIDRRKDVIIRSVKTVNDIDRTFDLGRKLGLSRGEICAKISSCLGQIAGLVVARWKISGMVLTGGDVAVNVCEVIGANRIRVENEIRPGIPVGRVVGGMYNGLRMVTKAGAFGDEDALAEVIAHLRRGRKSP